MKNRVGFRLVVVAGLVGFLTGCGGGGGSGSSSEVVQPEDAVINDAFINEQWYLNNVGQSALTSTGLGGVAGEDIQAFSSTFLSPENYAKGYKGNGVEIAIVDTGLEIRHEDLAANVVEDGSYNFLDGTNDPTSTVTDGDHGTSVAGLAAGRGGNAIGIWGVAPHASLRGFNYLKNQTLQNQLAALGYQPTVAGISGLNNETVSIFNKSYGSNPYLIYDLDVPSGAVIAQVMDVMQWGAENLRNGKGALYVKAAGNEYGGGSVFTSSWCKQAIDHGITCYNLNQETENNSPYQIMVGAFNADGKRSSYSNTGSSLWLAAPGGEYGVNSPGLLTADQSGCDKGYSPLNALVGFDRGDSGSGNESCSYFSRFNGSSSATPIVSGAIALLLEANPDLTWRDVKHILATTARQLDTGLAAKTLSLSGSNITIQQGWVENAAGYHFSNAYGFGAVHVQNAVQMALDWKASGTHLPDLVVEGKDVLPEQTFSSDNVIASGRASGLTKTQTVASSLTLETVMVTLDISATTSTANPNIDPSDYLIELISPAGTRSILLTPFNAYQSGNNMVGLVLATHAFYGESATGTWTLEITDVDDGATTRINNGGIGQLDAFQLTFYGHNT